ncbi:3-hydroxy-3-methylglutaryl-coenzyme A reductase-like [Tubulanus polymorphus]|uniref:3-hydroxy-3-methylglutaryl-coenzyme A reductase-like n=1 Tax=Tubulanus polymorphus TaxID=672921 RepID=UPI003DA2209A
MVLAEIFHAHGQLCACHPWEVIVVALTVTICLLSMRSFHHHDERKICGWNYDCGDETQHPYRSREVLVFLTVTKCLAIVYIYVQFRKLRKHGSKYLLGISGLFTLFSSFAFTSAMISVLENDLAELNEAFPFFLLLVDLCKASTLARFALNSGSQAELKDNIAKGMAKLGPMITLDAFVELLVISVGTLSGVQHLETICWLGCLSVVVNYLAFMTFYPACLALVLELSRGLRDGRPAWQIKEVASKMLLEDENRLKPNPVSQRVKIIMSAGLVLVHAHSRLVTSQSTSGLVSQFPSVFKKIEPEIPFWQFYIYRELANVDVAIAVLLTFFVIVKYVFFDEDSETEESTATSTTVALPSHHDQQSQTLPPSDQIDNAFNEVMNSLSVPVVTFGRRTAHFSIGDDYSDDDDDENNDVLFEEKSTQTGDDEVNDFDAVMSPTDRPVRPIDECKRILKLDDGPSQLSDDEVLALVRCKHIPSYKIESVLSDYGRGVSIRRKLVSSNISTSTQSLENLPYEHYDYKYVDGACCENVIGYMPIPVGVAGPLVLDGKRYQVPMATTEGTLVASTNRGCRALSMGTGVQSSVIGDGMTRAPVLRLPRIQDASLVKHWLDLPENYSMIKDSFDSTSRFARLHDLKSAQAGRNLYLRFIARTGDAMGMNMLSKGSEKAIKMLCELFPDIEVLSISGNYCIDKKPSAINWIEGRGKSVVCDAVIPAEIVKSVLKTSVPALVELNINKNLVGSAMAASIGGFNAHAANIVTAIFIATGQDPAQNVASSNCITLMEATGENNDDLLISVTMPCIEVGTVGGGTVLPPQAACLEMLGVCGASSVNPGENACQLARIICATVLAGELSLMSALAAGHLVRSHMRHNRSTLSMLGTASALPTKSSDCLQSENQVTVKSDDSKLTEALKLEKR